MKFLLQCLFLLFVSSGLMAQDTLRVSGKAIDDDTGEPLSFASIVIVGIAAGTYTDIDGNYDLLIPATGTDSLMATMMGYEPVKKPLTSEKLQTVNFRLRSGAMDLEGVVILAGENPANKIVKGIIRNKPKNRLSRFDAYQYEEYSKVELDLHQIDPKMRSSKVMKPFEFIFNNMDSVSDEKPFLPAFITETITEVSCLKGKSEKRMPKARQVSGVDNPTVSEFIESMHEEVDVYDNWMLLLQKSFVSPFADNGLGYYEYYIMDSTYIDGRFSYKLKFKPKRKQEPTFYGDFWVADTSYAIQKVNLRLSPDVNINLVNRIILYKEFTNISNEWVPLKSKMVFDFAASEKAAGLIGRKSSSYKAYQLNNTQTETTYTAAKPDEIDPETLLKEKSFWLTARHDSLTKNETAIYKMIDSIQDVPIFKTYAKFVYLLGSGYVELGKSKIEVGNLFNIYNYNLIQGHRLKLTLGTANSFSKKLRLWGFASYGFTDKVLRYGGNFQYNLQKYPQRSVIGGGYRYEVDFTTANSEEGAQSGFLSGIIRRPVPQKLLDIREGKLYYEHTWRNGFSGKLTLLHYFINPYENSDGQGGGLNFRYIEPISNDTITNVTTSEIILKLRYAYKEKFLDGAFTRVSLGTQYPRITLQAAKGIKGVLGSEYNYFKLMLNVQHWFYLNPIGWTSYDLKAGKTFGRLPYLLQEVHPGNEGFFHDPYTFNTMNRFEFASDTYAALRLEHHFEGFFLNHIPLLRKLKWREVFEFRAIYGTMSAENQTANRLNFANTKGTLVRSPSPQPFMETGFGIENIFKFIRVDGVWRLNYHDNPEAPTFVPMVSLNVYF